jgi:hypothetical protein
MIQPRRLPLRWLVTLLVMCLVVLQGAVRPARAAGAGDAAPLVRASTVAVVYVDLTRVDASAAVDWLSSVVEANQVAKPADRDSFLAELRDGKPEAERRLKAARDAGLREAFLLFDMPSPTNGNANDPVVALSLTEGTTPDQALAALFGEAPKGDQVALIEGLHVMGRAEQIERLKASPGVKRAEVDKAIATAGESPLAVLLVPPAGSLNVFPLMLPQLPAEFGSTDTKDLCDGVEALVLYGTAPADAKFNLHILCTNPRTLADAIAKTRAGIATTLQSGKLPGGAMDGDRAKLLTNLLDALPPFGVTETSVAMTLDDAALRKLGDLTVTAVIDARGQARQTQSMSNARQLLMGVILYATQNEGRFPANLDEIVKTLDPEDAGALLRVANTEEKFIYLKPTAATMVELKDSGSTILLLQPVGDKPATARIIAGFADGHVELLSVEELRNRIKDGTLKTADGSEV